jgi:uncharacterized protein (TIGR01777 family)
MKVIIPGGTGQVGGLLRCALAAQGHEVTVLSRRTTTLEPGIEHKTWDGHTLGDWADVIDGADAVINLAGRSVSCRYTDEHLRQMMDSRIDSTRAIGRAIAAASQPPRVWLQMSTATIYADRRDGWNDEITGEIGGTESGVPAYWEYSVRIAQRWEAAQREADLPQTRRVALRSAMVMTPDQGGIFDALVLLTRLGLGGSVAGGGQRVSWIHGDDFVRAISYLLDHEDVSGPVNIAAPEPVTQTELMKSLRHAWGRRFGLPATKQMAAIGAWILRTDPELLLKSRSVVPTRLLESGFTFEYPLWQTAVVHLAQRVRTRPEGIRLDTTARKLLSLNK